jgi:hypothetical protein
MAQNAKAVGLFNTIISDQKRSIDFAKKRIAFARSQRARIIKLAAPIADMLDDETNHHFAVNVQGWNDDEVSLYISLHDMEGMKAPIVLSILEYLNGLFDDSTDETSTRDSTSYLNRDFHFKSVEKKLSAMVAVYVKSDSATCKQVVIGSETKVVNKYKIVCD